MAPDLMGTATAPAAPYVPGQPKPQPMEEVEILTSLQHGVFGEGVTLHSAGETVLIPSREVNSLVLSGTVRRKDQSKATANEKIVEQRRKVAELEAKALADGRSAYEIVGAAIATGTKEQQDEANKQFNAAIAVRNEAIRESQALDKMLTDDMKEADRIASAQATARADMARTATTSSGGPPAIPAVKPIEEAKPLPNTRGTAPSGPTAGSHTP